MGTTSKNEITVEVSTATQCSFIPFTPVPDSWAGKRVRMTVIMEDELPPFPLFDDAE